MLTAETYATERAICDRADAYWRANATFGRDGGSSLPADARLGYAAIGCDNAMRGRVEQYEILTTLPDRLTVYGGSDGATVTTWTGDALGAAYETSRWRVRSYVGSHMHSYRVRIGGKHYVGRGFGPGMVLNLKAAR